MKFTYVIATCDANKDRLDACLQTWAKDIDLIILGSSWHVSKDDDLYCNVWKKINRFFAETDFTSDWYVLTCDDCYMHTKKLENWLAKIDTLDARALGHVVTSKPEGFRTGPGHVLNKAAMQRIKDCKAKFSHPEDVSLYKICKSCKIYIQDTQRSIINRSATMSDMLTKEGCGVHPVKPNDMLDMHRLIIEHDNRRYSVSKPNVIKR